MANKRTRFTITGSAWTRVVNGEVSAGIFRAVDGVSYYAMSYDDSADTPAGDIAANETAEEIFLDSGAETLQDSTDVYLWLRCDSGQTGAVIVTL